MSFGRACVPKLCFWEGGYASVIWDGECAKLPMGRENMPRDSMPKYHGGDMSKLSYRRENVQKLPTGERTRKKCLSRGRMCQNCFSGGRICQSVNGEGEYAKRVKMLIDQ